MKKFYTIITVAIFSFLAVASLEDDAPSIDSSTEPDFTVSAPSLFTDYSDNEIAADDRYKGKILQVSGTIRDIGNDIMDDAYVSLAGDGYYGNVQCFFSDKSVVANLKKGQQITVVGYCDGLMMNVLMKNCILK